LLTSLHVGCIFRERLVTTLVFYLRYRVICTAGNGLYRGAPEH
jgi:hypothetical protein